jgi:hypothetical protein
MIAVPNDLVNQQQQYRLCLRIIFQKDQGRVYFGISRIPRRLPLLCRQTFRSRTGSAFDKFIPHMRQVFGKLRTDALAQYHVYIIEQSDDSHKFNRGKLPISVSMARKSDGNHDVFIFTM